MKKKKHPHKKPAGRGNVVSIVGDVQRRLATEAQGRASASRRREAEAAAEMAATMAGLEDLDIDGAIAACDTLPPEEARISRLQFRSMRAMQRCNRGDVAGGLAEWEEVIAEEPKIASVYMMRAGFLRKTDPRAAMADVERAVALEPENPVLYARRGDYHVMLDDLPRAIADYRRALSLAPKQADVHYQLGKILAAHGDVEEALASYDRAVSLAPMYVDFRAGRGEVLLRLNQHERALADFNRGITIAPRDADCHVGRAKAIASLGRLPDAMAALERALAIAPDHGWAHMLRAIYVNGQEGEPARDRVKADLAAAVKSEPTNAAFLLKRGEYLLQFGDVAEALSDTEKAVAIAPGLPVLYYNLACCKARLADERRRLDPSYEEPEEARRERLGSALADLEKAVALGHDTEDLHAERVRLREARGDGEAAIRDALERGLGAFPDSEPLLRLRYERRRRAGDVAGADRDRARLVSLGFEADGGEPSPPAGAPPP